MRLLIVGTGLIGTSVGLAASKFGHEVWLADRLPGHAEVAGAMGAGSIGSPPNDPDIVMLAVPPTQTLGAATEFATQYVNATFTDVTSVKTEPVRDVTSISSLASRFVGGHPMAGLETSGPSGARADLFEDRLWILTPTATTEPWRLQQVRELVEACGAIVTTMTPDAHDRAVALTSHTPQILASLMAGLIASADADDIQLSGQGLRDLTRIASSNPELWDDILGANASAVDRVLQSFEERLVSVRNALQSGASLREVLHAGNAGRNRIPARHGGVVHESLVNVSVSIDDRPGALARLFATAAAAGISIDDVRIDHVLGREAAIVDLSVRPDKSEALRELLTSGGWQVRS